MPQLRNTERGSLSALETLNFGEGSALHGQDIVAYMAGSFGRKPELVEYMKEWEAGGNFCTSRWLKNEHEVDFQQDADALEYGGYGQNFAIEDVDDIARAECVIFFSSADSTSKGRGGRHTEFGITLGMNKPIFLIGRPECAFHAMVRPECRFRDWENFVERYEGAVARAVVKARFNRRSTFGL